MSYLLSETFSDQQALRNVEQGEEILCSSLGGTPTRLQALHVYEAQRIGEGIPVGMHSCFETERVSALSLLDI